MAGLIQRVPAGLLQVLNANADGENPRFLGDQLVPILELLQFYGLQQRQSLSATNAALTEGTVLGPTLPNNWCVFFGAEFQVVKTATMTAARASISMVRGGGSSFAVASEELGPFGATETGTARMAFLAPYPLLLPPGSSVFSRLDILGTDANASCGLVIEIGVLG